MSLHELPRLDQERLPMSSGVTSVLRQKIVDGTLAPGTRVAEEWVSREMGVSRGPVREALRELYSEGLVVVEPHRGTFVTDITPDELQNVLIPIRFILERESCLRALPNMTEENFEDLRAVTREMRRVAESPGPESLLTLVDLDVQFHGYLVDKGGQYHTKQVWQSIQPRIRAAFYRLGLQHSDLLEIAQEHETLLELLEKQDVQIAVEALEGHIYETNLALLNLAESSSAAGEKALVDD